MTTTTALIRQCKRSAFALRFAADRYVWDTAKRNRLVAESDKLMAAALDVDAGEYESASFGADEILWGETPDDPLSDHVRELLARDEFEKATASVAAMFDCELAMETELEGCN